MASPQKENGYVPIANEIVEHLAKIRISGEAMQVLWVILRKTYGFNKKADAIALSQFVDATGLKKQTIIKALAKLKLLNVITQKGYRTANIYIFIKDYDKWIPLPKKVMYPKKVTRLTQKGYKRNPKGDIQKTKYTTTKDTVASQSDAGVISLIISLFKEVNPTHDRLFGVPPQRAAVDRLLVKFGQEKLSAIVKYLPKSNASRYAPTITTPVQLERDLGRLIAWGEKQKDIKKTNVAFI